MRTCPRPLAGVLFDLDGTLLDSAPGLYAALQIQCAELDVPAPAYATVREVVSRGARAVLRTVFKDDDDATLRARAPRFLDIYSGVMGRHSHPFADVDALLGGLESAGVPWGVVTNKPGFLTDPLLLQLGLTARAAAVVSGDTLALAKPHPEPVLHACELARIDPRDSVFVGDDLRDIQAGRAAGLYTVAAAWGYLDGGDPHDWGADHVSSSVADLLRLLDPGAAS